MLSRKLLPYYQTKCVCSPALLQGHGKEPFISQHLPVSPLANLEAITTDSTVSHGPTSPRVRSNAGSPEWKVGEGVCQHTELGRKAQANQQTMKTCREERAQAVSKRLQPTHMCLAVGMRLCVQACAHVLVSTHKRGYGLIDGQQLARSVAIDCNRSLLGFMHDSILKAFLAFKCFC